MIPVLGLVVVVLTATHSVHVVLRVIVVMIWHSSTIVIAGTAAVALEVASAT